MDYNPIKMNKILNKKWIINSDLAKIFEVEVKAPQIAKKAHAGNFIIIRLHEGGERVPLTIADYNREKGTITIVTQVMGKSTHLFSELETGDYILDLFGPLGNNIELKQYNGVVVMIGGGVGIAPVYPQCKELKKVGNEIICILGARTKDLLFWEDKFRSIADEVIITTDDGSAGKKGFVTQALQELMNSKNIAHVIAIGPLIMMKFVADMTRSDSQKGKPDIPTDVSLNTIMVDGTGMCGGCRFPTLDGKIKYSCVDGPDVDGHNVNFEVLLARNNRFSELEERSNEGFIKERDPETCKLLQGIKDLKNKKKLI